MAKQVQLRRGDAAANSVFVGAVGEVTMDTTHNDLRIHDGSTVGGFRVPTLIDVQYPTSDNNYTWYRKWSDGWVEQGGRITATTDNQIITKSFLIPFIDIPMVFINFTYNITGSVGYQYIQARNVSTTSFEVTGYVTATPQGTMWRAEGMAA